jgi:4-hydroxy-tetrahydrodipicolinate synthase
MHELCVAAMAATQAGHGDPVQAACRCTGTCSSSQPDPVKWAMARMGLCGGTLRLPHDRTGEANEAAVEGALRACRPAQGLSASAPVPDLPFPWPQQG